MWKNTEFETSFDRWGTEGSKANHGNQAELGRIREHPEPGGPDGSPVRPLHLGEVGGHPGVLHQLRAEAEGAPGNQEVEETTLLRD